MTINYSPDGFELVKPNHLAGTQGGVRIRCTCGAVQFYPTKSVSQSCVTELVFKKFRQYGWIVGKKRADDKCPECQKRELKPVKQWSARAIVRPTQEEVPVMPVTQPKQTPLSPAEAAALDKRLDDVLGGGNEAPKAPNKSPLRATIKEQVAIADVMRAHIKPHASLPNVFEYDEDWSDQRVVNEAKLDRELSAASAASVRTSMFGPLVKRSYGTGDANARITALEAMVNHLANQVAALEDLVTGGTK